MAKEIPKHFDIINRPIVVTDFVSASTKAGVKICTVVELHPKKITILPLDRIEQSRYYSELKYGSECTLLTGCPELTLFLLKKG